MSRRAIFALGDEMIAMFSICPLLTRPPDAAGKPRRGAGPRAGGAPRSVGPHRGLSGKGRRYRVPAKSECHGRPSIAGRDRNGSWEARGFRLPVVRNTADGKTPESPDRRIVPWSPIGRGGSKNDAPCTAAFPARRSDRLRASRGPRPPVVYGGQIHGRIFELVVLFVRPRDDRRYPSCTPPPNRPAPLLTGASDENAAGECRQFPGEPANLQPTAIGGGR
jgi:hypothetical protein